MLRIGNIPVFLKVYLYKDHFDVFFLTNLQSGAAVQRQKKTQDTVNRAESAGTDCIICSENVATVTFNPCGHKVTCSGKTIQNRKKKPSALRMAYEAFSKHKL